MRARHYFYSRPKRRKTIDVDDSIDPEWLDDGNPDENYDNDFDVKPFQRNRLAVCQLQRHYCSLRQFLGQRIDVDHIRRTRRYLHSCRTHWTV